MPQYLLPLFSIGVLLAQAPLAAPRGAAAVAEAERAFAALSGRVGTPASFLANLAEDAVVFTPKPENGPAMQRAQQEDGSRLAWAPEFVEAAASGDFAVSTGPWDWRSSASEAATVHGHFLSIWALRKGRWQVLLDVGVSHPRQEAQALVLKTGTAPVMPGAQAALDAAWARFDREARADLGAALVAQAASDRRLYRPRLLVTQAGDPAPGGAVTWQALGAQVAPSVDLAVRWGLRGSGAAQASAVQVWRREGEAWRLAMDVELPLPVPKP